MSYSAEAHSWAQSFFSQISTQGLTTLVRRSDENWANRSTHILIESASSTCELIVWDSGDVELMNADGDAMSQTHSDVGDRGELRQLLVQFGRSASAIAKRAIDPEG